MTLNLFSGMVAERAAGDEKVNASRLVRDAQGLVRARLGAQAVRRGGRGRVRLQPALPVGRGARAALGTAASPLVRKVHRLAAAQGLALAARIRAERRALRLLRAALFPRARALRLHGEGGRPLVADLRRRLRRSRGETRRRDAPGDPELARQARPQEGTGSGDAAGKRTACRKARAALKSSVFIRTVPARATRALADGVRWSKRAGTIGNFSVANPIPPTTVWSS